MRLLTTGYEGENVEAWIDRLRSAGVTLVVDVRERTASRKKGFSKNTLQSLLAAQGIRYVHLPRLGTPPEMRRQYHQDRDVDAFMRRFEAHLDGQEDALRELSRIAEGETACLVCFERDPRLCHRWAIARRLEKSEPGKWEIVHLQP